MKKYPATIKDIAKALNVSPSTVSRALQDSHQISERTKKAVREMARKLNYQPNKLARSLLKRKTYSVGIVVPEASYYLNASAIQGIEEVLIPAGYSLMLCQTHERYEQEVLHCNSLVSQRMDGIIISIAGQTRDFAHFEEIQRKGIPLVLFDRCLSYPHGAKVVIDNPQAAFKAVTHLIRTGCQRIAFLLGPPELPIGEARRKGYEQALRKAGLPYDPSLVVHCRFGTNMGYDAAKRVLSFSPRPDAIFAINDRFSIGALAAIQDLGLNIPEDISLIGFNDEPYAALMRPGLTTIAQPAHDMGAHAARLLLKQMEKEGGHEETILLDTQLIERDSTRSIS